MRLREVGDGLGVVRVEMRDGRGSKLREITSMSKLNRIKMPFIRQRKWPRLRSL